LQNAPKEIQRCCVITHARQGALAMHVTLEGEAMPVHAPTLDLHDPRWTVCMPAQPAQAPLQSVRGERNMRPPAAARDLHRVLPEGQSVGAPPQCHALQLCRGSQHQVRTHAADGGLFAKGRKNLYYQQNERVKPRPR